jgi:chitodextrinase
MALKYLVASGANGTTSFASITDWWTSLPATFTEPEELACDDFALVETGGVALSGKTTSAANYARIYATAANRHDGRPRAASGKGLRVSDSSGGGTIRVGVNHLRLEGLEIEQTGGNEALRLSSAFAVGSDIRVDGCMIHDVATGAGHTIMAMGANLNLNLTNNIVYGSQRSIDTRGANSVTGENNVFWRHADQLGVVSGSELSLKDSYSGRGAGSTECFWSGGAPTGNNNASSDATATARFTSSLANIAGSDVFVSVTPGAEDFNLKAGANALVDAGGAVTVTTDALGNPRSYGGGVDIGAIERDAGAPPPDAPTGVATQDAPDGQSIRFHGTTTDATSGTYTLTGSNGGVTVGPLSFAVSGDAFDFTVAGLVPGDYTPTLTVTGSGGTAGVTGTSTFSIMGVSGAGEVSEPTDTTAPTLTGSITPSSITTTGFTISWPAGTDNVAVTGYEFSTDGGATWSDAGNVLTKAISGLTAGTAYQVRVRAYDAAGNRSTPALSATITTSASGDTTAPTLAGSITPSNIAQTSFTISWPAGADNVGVTGYEYRLNAGTWVNAGNVQTANVTGLTANTLYNVDVRAYDAAGNRSTPAITAGITTLAVAQKSVTLTLVNAAGAASANLANLKWAWFDAATPSGFAAPTDKGAIETTDASGVVTIPLPNTTLASGQIGWLIITDSDGNPATNHKAFSGPAQVN